MNLALIHKTREGQTVYSKASTGKIIEDFSSNTLPDAIMSQFESRAFNHHFDHTLLNLNLHILFFP
jgi:hypothetical protein